MYVVDSAANALILGLVDIVRIFEFATIRPIRDARDVHEHAIATNAGLQAVEQPASVSSAILATVADENTRHKSRPALTSVWLPWRLETAREETSVQAR
jgi:hypothetical protein